MLSAALQDPTWGSWLQHAAAQAGVELSRDDALSWWRRDLVLVGPEARLIQALPDLSAVWLPMVVGVGECPSEPAAVWCDGWLRAGDVSGLARLLPRAARAGAQRRTLRRCLAHDLRGPIGVVSGYCELLSEQLLGALEEKQLGAVSKIQDQNERLLRAMEDLALVVGPPDGVTDPTRPAV